jgi:hypothetical protein|nr:MAG TPA: hypothetical protein [Caudoviricetes sp.]
MYIKEDNKMFLKNLITTELAEKMKNIGFKERCFLYFYKRNPGIFHFELDKMENNYEGTHKNMEFVNYNDSLQKISIFDYETAFEWFRDRGLIGTIEYDDFGLHDETHYNYGYMIRNISGDVLFYSANYKNFEKYEEAREELVNKLIELYENN